MAARASAADRRAAGAAAVHCCSTGTRPGHSACNLDTGRGRHSHTRTQGWGGGGGRAHPIGSAKFTGSGGVSMCTAAQHTLTTIAARHTAMRFFLTGLRHTSVSRDLSAHSIMRTEPGERGPARVHTGLQCCTCPSDQRVFAFKSKKGLRDGGRPGLLGHGHNRRSGDGRCASHRRSRLLRRRGGAASTSSASGCCRCSSCHRRRSWSSSRGSTRGCGICGRFGAEEHARSERLGGNHELHDCIRKRDGPRVHQRFL